MLSDGKIPNTRYCTTIKSYFMKKWNCWTGFFFPFLLLCVFDIEWLANRNRVICEWPPWTAEKLFFCCWKTLSEMEASRVHFIPSKPAFQHRIAGFRKIAASKLLAKNPFPIFGGDGVPCLLPMGWLEFYIGHHTQELSWFSNSVKDNNFIWPGI